MHTLLCEIIFLCSMLNAAEQRSLKQRKRFLVEPCPLFNIHLMLYLVHLVYIRGGQYLEIFSPTAFAYHGQHISVRYVRNCIVKDQVCVNNVIQT